MLSTTYLYFILHAYLNLFTYVPKFKTIGILKKQTYFILNKCLCFDYEMPLFLAANTFVFTKEHSISFKRYGISFKTYGISLSGVLCFELPQLPHVI